MPHLFGNSSNRNVFLCKYLYDKNCFNKLSLNESPITRQKTIFCVPIIIKITMIDYFETVAGKATLERYYTTQMAWISMDLKEMVLISKDLKEMNSI